MHTDLEEILLSEIAYKGFEIDKLFFDKREVVDQIKLFLASNMNAPQNLDGEKVLKAIAVQQGILVERLQDIFSFSHLTLQEYLTAQYIEDNRQSQLENLVTRHLTDRRWKEVFLLVAGLMRGGADNLLLLMEKEAQNYINSPRLQDLLRWVERATSGSEGNFKPVGKRAITIAIAIAYANPNAIAIANPNANPIANPNANPNANPIANPNANPIANANAYVYAYAYAYAYANPIAIANAYTYTYANAYAYAYAYTDAIAIALTNAYGNAITKAINLARYLEEIKIFKAVDSTRWIARLKELKVKIPNNQEPIQVRRKFVNRIHQTCLAALALSPDLLNLSQEQVEAWGNYLYANKLMLQCKEAAVRVSPETWNAIEGRMLLINGD